jgi:HAMP domain-containing protein/HPt (histidine-containing phosphotransfer) domain-containing protein
MKNTIQKRLLFSLILPFVFLFFALSFAVAWVLSGGDIPSVFVPGRHLPFVVLAYLALSVVFVALLFVFISFRVIRPLGAVTQAAEDIAGGNLERNIDSGCAGGEIGAMAQALRRMVEQFQVHIAVEEQSGRLLDMYTRLNTALWERDDLHDVFGEAIALLCDYYRLSRVEMVLLVRGEPQSILRRAGEKDEDGLQARRHFSGHGEAVALLKDRNFVYLNRFALQKHPLSFASENTVNLCILPLRSETELRGYLIMESDDEASVLVSSDASLLFLSGSLSYILQKKEPKLAAPEAEQAAAPEEVGEQGAEMPVRRAGAETEDELIARAKSVPGLDVEKGLSHIGDAEQYLKLLKVTGRILGESAETMRGQFASDIHSFAISVHGCKGALYSIGAQSTGDRAFALEKAAKAEDADYCRDNYSDFEEELLTLARDVGALFPEKAASEREPGEVAFLKKALEETVGLLKSFDLARAEKTLAPALESNWGEHDPSVRKIAAMLDNIEYDEAQAEIESLLSRLGG